MRLVYSFLLSALLALSAQAADFSLQPDGTIIDQAGRRIVFKKPFTRIISLYAAHTENLFALGLGDALLGVSTHEDFPPQALRKPVFSYHDDAEKFLAAAPDLVLVRPMIDRGYPALMRRLEQSGITVVSLQPGTVARMKSYWRILGRLGGRLAAAEAMITTFEGAVTDFKALTQGVIPKHVYFESIHRKMKTFTPTSMAIFVLETAGGVNVAGDARAVHGTNIAAYGKERILAHADEIDVYLSQKGPMNRVSMENIIREPGFSAIRAVKEGRVFIVEESIVSRPTTRLLLGIDRIGGILYPQRFAERGKRILKQTGFFQIP